MSNRTEITKEIANDGTESITYSKTWESNGISHRKEVRKVEGGYIINESKYGRPKDQGEDADYVEERREYVTTENPLEKKKDETEDEKMFDFIDTKMM